VHPPCRYPRHCESTSSDCKPFLRLHSIGKNIIEFTWIKYPKISSKIVLYTVNTVASWLLRISNWWHSFQRLSLVMPSVCVRGALYILFLFGCFYTIAIPVLTDSKFDLDSRAPFVTENSVQQLANLHVATGKRDVHVHLTPSIVHHTPSIVHLTTSNFVSPSSITSKNTSASFAHSQKNKRGLNACLVLRKSSSNSAATEQEASTRNSSTCRG